MPVKEVGLFFGSFNPIHHGHLMLANFLLTEVPFDEIWFVVSPHNPHKSKENLADEYHRLEMVNLAINDFKYFKACDIEFAMPKPSYTIDTLIRLQEKYPSKVFSLIMGSDNLANFHRWKNYDLITKHFKIVVYPRRDAKIPENSNVTIIDAPLIEMSSSFIREQIKKGKQYLFYVPATVHQYIEDCGLYK
ncbi:MAG: nicotinate (nicotinamide) nucleotide adenylyltransferase [Bacteroidales bacterium]|nr:nicotinate (nicotinamide) nucleotide adenylyltransferase [Bacteroidales bacterium]